jgi:hypothetical protein
MMPLFNGARPAMLSRLGKQLFRIRARIGWIGQAASAGIIIAGS